VTGVYTVSVSDHMMVAHSLHGEVFGPSQRLHGATYVVVASLSGESLDDDGIVVDIGCAAAQLREVLGSLDRRNLDDESAFAGRNTTTEVLARHIADRLAERAAIGALGAGGSRLAEIAVTLQESPVASATYRRGLDSS